MSSEKASHPGSRLYSKPGKILAAAGSAILMTLGFAPFNLVPILLISLVPLIWAVFETDLKGCWRLGYLTGFIFAIGELHWLYQLTVKWTQSVGLALFPYLVACFLYAIYFGWIVWMFKRCVLAGWYWAIPLIWAGVEAFRSYIPVLSFPWGLLASPFSAYPELIQPAHFGTIYLISAWIVALDLVIVLWARNLLAKRKSEIQLKVLTAVAVVFPILSLIMFTSPRPTAPIRVTIGQTGLDMAYEDDPQLTDLKIAGIVKGFDKIAVESKSKLLVLPEGIAHIKDHGEPFNFHLDPRAPIILGAQREDSRKKKTYQSAMGFDGSWKSVDKTRLVIFGEFVPGRDILPYPAAFKLPNGDLSAGEDGVRSVTVGGTNVGALLCFEGLFPDLGYRQSQNGVALLAVMSIDDWFMNSTAPVQLRGASIWRAIETGLPVARAASLGSSLACDGKGRVISEVPVGKSVAFTVDLPSPVSPPFTSELPMFPLFSFLLVLFVSLQAAYLRFVLHR